MCRDRERDGGAGLRAGCWWRLLSLVSYLRVCVLAFSRPLTAPVRRNACVFGVLVLLALTPTTHPFSVSLPSPLHHHQIAPESRSRLAARVVDVSLSKLNVSLKLYNSISENRCT